MDPDGNNLAAYGSKRKATLSDVAAAAGVSLSTASKALRNQKRVSEDTRQRVLAAAEQLSYTPNAFAQSLVSGRSRTIGIVTQDLQGRFCTPALIGAERKLDEHRTSIMLTNAHGDAILERNHIRALLSRNIEGLIVINPETNPRLPVELDMSVPVVYAYAPSIRPSDASVTCDNIGAGKLAVSHLVEVGSRRLAIICGERSYRAATDRLEGALEQLDEYGLSPISAPLFGDWSEEWGRVATRRLIDDGIMPDGIVCQSDQIARGCMHALWHAGITVPDNVAIIGHDNWDVVVSNAKPTISSISNEVEAIGALAAGMLVDAINGSPHHGTVYTPCKLYPRETTLGLSK